MKYPRKWEEIKNDEYTNCSRLKIHGGWLVIFYPGRLRDGNLIFIEDSEHQWEFEEKNKGLFFRPKP